MFKVLDEIINERNFIFCFVHFFWSAHKRDWENETAQTEKMSSLWKQTWYGIKQRNKRRQPPFRKFTFPPFLDLVDDFSYFALLVLLIPV